MSATGSHQNMPLATRHEHGAEHEDLVGQRIEEGARPGGALPAGQVAVEAVGAGEARSRAANADHDAARLER